ncbi:hypothetical protein A2U01_0018178 [Trifolium medium]|uniref:Uncharacterized protein n=1 Tax=Trifolium medium TaxID=97028 RepID=A0A392NDH0_9FABA|nr:hypothetical protein [Trifolium medium]
MIINDHQGSWPSAVGYIYNLHNSHKVRIHTQRKPKLHTQTDLSVGVPAGTQPPPLHQGLERSNARRGHSSDQVRSVAKPPSVAIITLKSNHCICHTSTTWATSYL